jgi:glutathione S-transferase
MVVKLYGYPMSTCTKRVVVVLHETNTPFELEVVDLSCASSFMNAPPLARFDLTRLQGADKGPRITCRNSPLARSHALRVLSSRTRLARQMSRNQIDRRPDSLRVARDRAIHRVHGRFQQKGMWPRALSNPCPQKTEAVNFDPHASGIALQRVSNPRRGGKSDEERIAELAGALAGKLGGYERILWRTEDLAGDELPVADLFHFPYGAMLAPQKFTFLEDANKYPNVAR